MRYHEFLLEYDRAKAMAGFGNKLLQRWENDPDTATYSPVPLPLSELFDMLERADPSPNKQYVNWMARIYQNGSKLEDILTRGGDALDKFQKLLKHRELDPEHADIGKYKSLTDLENVMEQYDDISQDTTVVKGKIKELLRTSSIRVIQIFDKEAAMYYGQGTRWCTAARGTNNMYAHYAHSGDLYIILPQHPKYTGEKYQLWISGKRNFDVQLMDEKDKAVTYSELKRRYPDIAQAMEKVPGIPAIFKSNPSRDDLTQMIMASPFSIRHIENPDEQLQLIAVNKFPEVIEYIAEPPEAVQLLAVQNSPTTIINILHPTEKVKQIAISASPDLIEHVNNPSLELQKLAVYKRPSSIQYIKNPSKLLQLRVVRIDGNNIRYINAPSEAIQFIAVTNKPYAINWISHPSLKIQMAAVNKQPDALYYISNPHSDVIKAAIDKDPRVVIEVTVPAYWYSYAVKLLRQQSQENSNTN